MKLVFATHNQNKANEIEALLPEGFEVLTLDDIGVNTEIPETGTTLEENARIKAEYILKNFNTNCFADDTGLEVLALNNEPGVYSARYAGPQKSDQANISLLLENLKGVELRTAQFRTVIVLFLDGNMHEFEGIVQGKIIDSRRGDQGFGYDPVFVPEGYDKTFAEMNMEEKNKISHRGRALKKMVEFLSSYKVS